MGVNDGKKTEQNSADHPGDSPPANCGNLKKGSWKRSSNQYHFMHPFLVARHYSCAMVGNEIDSIKQSKSVAHCRIEFW